MFMTGLVSACLDSPDCVKSGDTALIISFRKLSDGKADTVVLMNVIATGADSVFYKSEPDKLDTLSLATLSVNPYAEETEFIFVLETESGTEQKILKVGYRNEIRFISEECGSDLVQLDLAILETQFDSVRVVNSVLTKSRTTNLEIFN